MKRIKRIGVRLFWVLGLPIAILTVLVAAIPYLIDLDPVVARIEKQISRKIHGKVEISGIETSLWPRPHLLLQDTNVSIPGTGVAEIQSLHVYPHLLSLLRGKLRFADVGLEKPRIALDIPPEGITPKGDLSLEQVSALLSGGLQILRREMPDLEVSVDGGVLALATTEKVLFWFRRLDAEMDVERGTLEIDAESNLWDRIGVDLDLDVSGDLQSEGSVRLRGFQPQGLIAYLKPRSDLLVKNIRMDFDVEFQMRGAATLNASIQANWPEMTVFRGSDSVALEQGSLDVDFTVNPVSISAALSDLTLASPPLRATGKWVKTEGGDDSSASHTLEIRGSDIQVAPLRDALLTLVGQHKAVLKTFAVLRAGHVPEIVFRSQGAALTDLGHIDHMVIEGDIVNGAIDIAKPAMAFTGVKGDVTIRDGVLNGVIHEGIFADSRGHEGSLTLGLTRKNRVFKLDIGVESNDVHPLYAFLKKEFKDKALGETFRLIRDVHGPTSGRLVLGDSLDRVSARAEASNFQWRVQLADFKAPLRLKGKQMKWDGKRLVLQSVNGALGGSTVRALSGPIGMNAPYPVSLTAGATKLFLPEIHELLNRLEPVRAALEEIEAVDGVVAFRNANLKGNLATPEAWRYQATGTAENFSLSGAFLPGTLSVSSGRFSADQERLDFADAQFAFMDASGSGSGSVKYLQDAKSIDMSLTGTLGKQALGWLESLGNVPSALFLRAPLSVAESRLQWDERLGMAFTANFSVVDGPKVELDVLSDEATLTVNKLALKDAESDVSARLVKKKRTIDLLYEGTLTQNTVDRLLTDNPVLKGWVKGALQAKIVVDRPQDSTATGSLEGQDIVIARGGEPPLTVRAVALAANGQQVNVHSADLDWSGNSATVQGNVEFRPQAVRFDLDAQADRLVWNHVAAADGQGKGATAAADSGEETDALPLQGVVRLHALGLDFDDHAISPFRADIAFENGHTEVRVIKGEWCGINLPGVLSVSTAGMIDLDIEPTAQALALETTMPCVVGKQDPVYGAFDLKSQLKASGAKDALMETANGKFQFLAKDGKIFDLSFSGRILNRIFAVLNLPRLFSGKLPDLDSEGFLYHSFEATGNVQKSKLLFSKIVLDGESMKLLGDGEIDIKNKTIKLDVMVAPLKTLDWLISKIPLINRLADDGLAIIPVSVTGSIDDPTVIPMDPTLVGSKLLTLAERTFTFPFKLINPLFSSDKKTKD